MFPIGSLILWGFVATLAMTTIMQASQGLGLSRLSLPFLMGTFVTGNRNVAMPLGFLLYLMGGWIFASVYFWFFTSLGTYTWWLGSVAGFLHGVFLLVAIPLLPSIHPRMASEYHGATSRRQLEPPGFLAMNYGYQTPAITLLAQTVYGATLGGCMQLQRFMDIW